MSPAAMAPRAPVAPAVTPSHTRSPFDDVVVPVAIAVSFAVAAVVWILVGDRLPGGRWLAVHLFTLGVLSNVILAFTRHFTETLTKVADGGRGSPWVVWFNGGALAVMVGMAGAWRPLVAAGATVATVAVLGSSLDLRRARRRALGARFAWIVRCYEHAHGAFVHGAVLGALMGAGLLSGSWYGAARIAHLHVNLLGWAAVTLLATLVFFGPTMARTRIEAGADDRAARALRLGIRGVTIATLALLASGVGGGWGVVSRSIAAVALAVFAWSATSTCRAVRRAVVSGRPGAAREPVAALCRWLPLLAWADVVVVATGSWRGLDALGLGLLLGVFVQAIATTLTYLAPMLLAGRTTERTLVRQALDRFARVRSLTFNLGVAAVVATAAAGTAAGFTGGVVARLGWAMVLVATMQPVATVLANR